ncbi:penicillin-binding protein 1C [Pseudohalocynthiibacter aestuariivivens]|jgi:penicillin-binding protein 1C|uniref:peptidoglycan glycosyltransferase n=1 Tax=Pseudohalocynthiibacter aestuariivivens TaxID=1591409 RepID=A0ABV5JJD1_9RHOB|nr:MULTISPECIES: penicillin-binding protein 1C [Pseudohalocynthiibacter]MBS9718309.1 penicillin-binding protein 1C [Pseudohalocynthiibacter aestuariivivens]MCK0103532.1 penicillin-binding protein 1C [Pseudohalocynthiibacter sp. F2068]
MIRRFGIFLLVAGLLITAAVRDEFDRWVNATELPVLLTETSVEVLARDGTLLRAYTVADGRWRLATTLDGTDPGYLQMLIAFEDKRFFQHSGVDLRAMLRALGQAIWNGRVVSGGSTLTMQVARLLEDSGTGHWAGKLRQIRVALALERQLTKEQILTLYLNRAPFGGNLEGLRAATRAYFGKDPRRLTPAQAAVLIALPQAPETRRPDRYQGRATVARDRVLERMSRAGILDAGDVIAAKTESVPAERRSFPALAPHIADRAIAENSQQNRHDLTLDAALQSSLEKLASDAVAGHGDRLSVAMLVADHQTGEILASVGSASYRADGRQGFVDMTQALRSPGSTLKPLVYALAFEQGLAHPETLIDDRPTAFGSYMPQNFDGAFRGTLRVRDALQQSLNIPVVTLTEALGPAHLMARLRRSGATPVVPGGQPGLAVALGGVGITLTDMVQLYGALANGGMSQPLRWKTGSIQAENNANVTSPEAAWQVGNILSGLAPPPNAPRNRLAYKTGTSYGHRDAWAIGYDGKHVIGVWFGRPDGTPVPGVFGGDLAAPLLFDAFARLKPELAPLPPPPPATLIVGNADLPQPLQRFRSRTAVFEPDNNAPKLAFPPDGAVLDLSDTLVVKVRNGLAPFTWLMNGQPVVVSTYERQSQIPLAGPGFLHLSVIDAEGQAARADISLR